MSMTTLDQLAVVPALLVTLAATLILRDDDGQTRRRRYLLFLPALGVVLLVALLLVASRPGAEPNPLSFRLPVLLSPTVVGLTALIVLNLNAYFGLDRRTRRLALVPLLLFIALLAASALNPRLALPYLVLPGAVLIALGWLIGRRYGAWSVILSFLALGLLLLVNANMHNPPGDRLAPPSNMGLQFLLAIAAFGAPGFLAAISAALVAGALRQPTGQPASTGRKLLLRLALPALLLGALAYLLYWWSVWDNTVDMGYGGISLFFLAPTAIGAGMVAAVTLFRKASAARWLIVALLFIVLVPAFLYEVHELGMSQSHHQITEDRAARIASALEDYQAREGRYPPALEALVPRDLLYIPRPIILQGETWCYRGGEGAYQLAAFHREFFSSPVSLQSYASAGDPPTGDLPCSERLAEMKDRYYSPMDDPRAAQPPVPTPLPTVEVPGGKTVVQPILDGAAVSPGSWSPDGATFVFGAQTATLALHFLDARTGDICPTEGQVAYAPTLRQRHVWLPDGRLLYLDSNGEMLAFTPCEPQPERLTERFEATFTLMPAVAHDGSHILLQSEDAYWILDGASLAVQRIESVAPNPYDLHWDTFAWLPAGDEATARLAIAQLNGRDGSKGSTLHLVDGQSGDVLKSLPLATGNDQSPGFVEGLPGDRVLMHGNGQWLMLDFSADPPATISIMPQIFGLDVVYPDEVSAAGSFIQEDGANFYLVVRLNHARNTATYLYDSATGGVHVFDHEFHTLLLFPHGEIVEMANLELVQEKQDTYDLVRAAEPEAPPLRLVFEGHTPRDYPHLSIKYLSRTDQIAVASAHGVSLVSLPDGKRIAFYDLPGPGFSPWLIVAPDGSAFVATKDQGGLYGPLP